MSKGRGRCRFCGAPLAHTFANLGMSPIANNYLTEEELSRPEPFYPQNVNPAINEVLQQITVITCDFDDFAL